MTRVMLGIDRAGQATPNTAAAPTPSATPAPIGQTPPASQDPGAVAFVPKPGGPPDTSGYMTLGYVVTFVLYAGYIALVLRRIARVRRAR